jgi:preprotein translocase subunit SecD
MQILDVAAWLAVAVTPVLLSGQTSSTPRCDSIQYRFVDQGAPTTGPRRRSVQDGQSYALRDSIVVDGRGIAEIQVWAHGVGTDTTWDVTARLTPAAASAMAAATSRHLGQTLAVLLGDTIIDHGIIERPLGARLPVRLGVTRREADSLAVRVRRAIGTSCNVP